MSGRLKIATISSPLVEGGIATHLKEVVPRLRERGHRVVFVTGKGYGGALEADLAASYRSHLMPHYGFMPSAMLSIFRVISDCDIVHVHGYPHFLADYLTVMRPLHRKPLVITMHGSFHQYGSQNIRLLKSLHNLVMLRFTRSVDRFIAVSEAERNEMVRGGIPAGKTEVVYNGISPCPHNRSYRNGDAGRILYLGRLTSTKNPEILLRAVSHAAKTGDNIKLVMAGGDWGERSRLESLASALGMNDCVEFTGEVAEEDKARLFASSDVFVHPSLQDIFSLCILEASAAGLPTVAFNIGGNSEMIDHGRTGILVDETTPEALSQAILRMLEDRAAARKMGEEACRHVLGKFSWDETASGLERVYKGILNGKRGQGE